MPQTDVKAILFDTFGTLVDWRSSLVDALSAWGAARSVTADWTGLVDAWRAGYAPSMDRVRMGRQPWTKLDDLHRETLGGLVGTYGAGDLSPAELDELTLFWHRLHPWPDVVPGLTRLHTRHILAPLSNGNVSLLVDLARFARLPFDMIFGGDVSRHYKPDPETYLGACAMLGLPPGAVMMCAAHNGDLAAARQLGLQTAFIPRPTEYGPHQSRDFTAESDWTVVADNLNDLAARLGC